ncbi:MAG: PEGA domain-containing protein, partial [Myxococcaceae bacterium]|nr:PEGA domain-containing protein [Myxococcaceae bacterium]
VLRTALEKDRERRYADAAAMKAALLAASAAPPRDEQRLERWVELERAQAPAAGPNGGPQATATLDPPRPASPAGPPETTTDREQPAPARRRLVLLAAGALPVLLAMAGLLAWNRDGAPPVTPAVAERVPTAGTLERPDASTAQAALEVPDAGPGEARSGPDAGVTPTPTPALPTPRPRPKPVVVAPKARASGWLTLDCRPGWAEVFLKGERLGITPLVQTSLPQGTHEVELVRKDGARKKVKVVVRADQTTKVVVPWTAE